MKKFVIAALAASILASPVLASPWDNGHDGRGGYVQQQRQDDQGHYAQRNDDHGRYDRQDDRRDHGEYRNWQRGDRFDGRYARNYQVIYRPDAYRLRPAPHGYRWVQSGNDAVLVGVTTGIVAAVMANMLH